MNPEQIKQVVETIKTLNINFNDATTQKIAEQIMPVFKLYLAMEIGKYVLDIAFWLIISYGAFRLIKLFLSKEITINKNYNEDEF